MTTEHKHTLPWPWESRPRDLGRDTTELTFETYYFIGPLPRRIWVTDVRNRGCWYDATDMLILEPITRRMCLRYETHGHSWDQMPQVLLARDGNGNSARYEPQDPREESAHCPLD